MWLDFSKIQCPYCGELIELLLEPLEDSQEYIEDCQVCCQPITIIITPTEPGLAPQITSIRGDETA